MNGLKYHTVNDLSVRLEKFKLINTIEHNKSIKTVMYLIMLLK